MAAGDGRTWTADRIILAVGGHAARLPIPGADLALTYEDIRSLTSLPDRVAVIGGADTGCQIASIFDDFGVAVTLFEAGPALVPAADADVSAELGRAFRNRGMTVATGHLRHRPAPGGGIASTLITEAARPSARRPPTRCSSRSAGPPASRT